MSLFSKYFLIFFLGIGLSACSQNQKQIMQNPQITADNIVEEISKQVKYYDYEPVYQIEFTINHCYAEILVNDILIYKSYEEEGESTTESINYSILSKGDQRITIKMYATEQNKKFINNSGVDVEIGSYDNKIKYSDKGKDIFQYSTKKDKDGIFIATGKTFYEETVTFNLSDVPYHNSGWRESQDLRRMNSAELEKKVIGYYQEMQNAIKNKDLDKIARMSYNKLRDQFVSEYATREDIQEAWDEIVEVVNMDKELFPLDDYEMVFYGDGKLVGLRSKKMDKKFRGTSALFMKIKKDGQTLGTEFYHLLHIPKGKTEFEVY